MRRVLVGAFLTMWTVGCSHSGTTGPSYPPLAGSYSATFAVTATSSAGSVVLGTATGTVTLNNAGSGGSFTGSFIEGGSAGTIVGTEEADGGLLISQFGNPNVAPLADLEILQQELPECAFGNAVSDGMTGTIASGQLNLAGGLTLPCVWDVAGTGETLTTTLAITIGGAD
jgi:hypothetical protein